MNAEVINSIITLISSALGAAIGGYFAFRIAIWQLNANQRADLEKDVEPFFLELRIEWEKIHNIYAEIQELRSQKNSPTKWNDESIRIVKQNQYRIVDLSGRFLQVQSQIYRYSYNRNNNNDLYRTIQLFVEELSYLTKEQNRVEEIIKKDTSYIWLDEEIQKLGALIRKIDPEIKLKFFQNDHITTSGKTSSEQ